MSLSLSVPLSIHRCLPFLGSHRVTSWPSHYHYHYHYHCHHQFVIASLFKGHLFVAGWPFLMSLPLRLSFSLQWPSPLVLRVVTCCEWTIVVAIMIVVIITIHGDLPLYLSLPQSLSSSVPHWHSQWLSFSGPNRVASHCHCNRYLIVSVVLFKGRITLQVILIEIVLAVAVVSISVFVLFFLRAALRCEWLSPLFPSESSSSQFSSFSSPLVRRESAPSFSFISTIRCR